MKTENYQWKEDVEDLVERVTFEEAHLAVQKLFEKALSQLSPPEQELLESHWRGASLEELSLQASLSPQKTQLLINQLKKTLITHLQRSVRARH